MKRTQANDNHEALRRDMLGLLRKHSATVDAVETLALAAHVVGQIMALQDQFKYTPQQLTNLVVKNIEEGNRRTIEDFINAEGGNA